jgi:hypothetical protein
MSVRDLVVQTFIELHAEEHISVSFPDECPFCDLLIKRTIDEFKINLADRIEPVITEIKYQWDRLGYLIADKCSDISLTDSIVSILVNHPIRAARIDEALTGDDILNHPYVLQKYKEVTK